MDLMITEHLRSNLESAKLEVRKQRLLKDILKLKNEIKAMRLRKLSSKLNKFLMFLTQEEFDLKMRVLLEEKQKIHTTKSIEGYISYQVEKCDIASLIMDNIDLFAKVKATPQNISVNDISTLLQISSKTVDQLNRDNEKLVKSVEDLRCMLRNMKPIACCKGVENDTNVTADFQQVLCSTPLVIKNSASLCN